MPHKTPPHTLAAWCVRAARRLLPALALLALAAAGHAATLTVPAQYTTIQAAVNAAQSGDTVLVADGTYTGDGNRDIDFGGKNLTVTSQNGAAKTIIDCGGTSTTDGSGNHRGFYLHSGETAAVISGLTIENGYEANASGVADSGGGGGICIDGSSVAIQNCTISNNAADTLGGGIGIDNLVNGPNVTRVTNCIVTGNTAQDGGGIFSANSDNITDNITLTGCTVSGNTAQFAGGVYNSNAGSSNRISMTDCNVSGNVAAEFGGGIENDNAFSSTGVITLTRCIVSSNTATAESGGGIYNDNEGFGSGNNGTITLIGCTVTNNSAGESGGGVANGNTETTGTIALSDCTISGNHAQNAGGVQSDNGSSGDATSNGTITLTNCAVIGNTASGMCGGLGCGNENYGGDLGGIIAVTNCTVSGNAAMQDGGSNLYNNGGSITLTNDVVYGDTGGEIVDYSSSASPVSVTHCDIQGGYAGAGNINADPLFISAALGNFHLKPGSPCLGAGTATGAPTTDKDGATRPAPPSIGAYEEASAGRTHLLWTSTSGAAAIWTLGAGGSVTSTPALGPVAGWTAKSIADGPDGLTRLLWTRADGESAVWTVNDADGTFTSSPGYGPYAGWQVVSLAVGADDLARLQWKRDSDGMSSLWTVAADGSVTSTPGYGPYGPSGRWTAGGLAVGQDGLTHLLWDNSVTGQCSVWTFDGSGITSTPALGSAFDFPLRPFAVAGGPDGKTRLLMEEGGAGYDPAVWTVDGAGEVAVTPLPQPYGWGITRLAVGPDALSRVLLTSGGACAVWTVNADGSIASTPAYGPIAGWSAIGLSVGP